MSDSQHAARAAWAETASSSMSSMSSPDTFVNVMPQYRPEGMASRFPAINRPLSEREYREAVAVARKQGLRLARD